MEKGRTIQGVVFDLDGTLVDHDSAEAAALKVLHANSEELSQLFKLSDFIKTWRREAGRHFLDYLKGKLTFREQRLRRMKGIFAGLGKSIDDLAADNLFATFLTEYERHWRLFPDVLPCIEALGGLKLGVLTNGDSLQQRKKVKAVELLSRFDSIVISSEIGCAKPHSEAFAASAAQLGLHPEQVAYVGDDLELDALAATQAGMKGIWLNREASLNETYRSDATVLTLTELPAVIAR